MKKTEGKLETSIFLLESLDMTWTKFYCANIL